MGAEEHGGGRQLLRFRTWARVPASGVIAVAVLAASGAFALSSGGILVGVLLLASASGVLCVAAAHAARALAALEHARPAAESEAPVPVPVAAPASSEPAPAAGWAIALHEAAGKEH